jgi:hypothetical protein
MPMSHLSHERDLDGRKRLGVAVCQRLGGPTTWHQTGDDGRLDPTALTIAVRALKNGGAVLIQGSDDIEHTFAVAAQIEDAS